MARNGTGKGGGLSPRDAQLAGLVAGGSTYAEAAGQLKISERTVKRAMSRPEVRAEVDAVRGRTLETGLGLLCANFMAAVTELGRLVREATPLDAVRLGAVRVAIGSVLKVREHAELARRLEALEDAANEHGGPPEGAGKDDGGPPDGPPDADGGAAGSGGGSGDGEGGS